VTPWLTGREHGRTRIWKASFSLPCMWSTGSFMRQITNEPLALRLLNNCTTETSELLKGPLTNLQMRGKCSWGGSLGSTHRLSQLSNIRRFLCFLACLPDLVVFSPIGLSSKRHALVWAMHDVRTQCRQPSALFSDDDTIHIDSDAT